MKLVLVPRQVGSLSALADLHRSGGQLRSGLICCSKINRSQSSIPTDGYATAVFTATLEHHSSSSSFEPSFLREEIVKGGRPWTTLERLQRFPIGVQELWMDFQHSQLITEASHTRLNAWTINHPLRKLKNRQHSSFQQANYAKDQDGLPPGRIPRRQHEHQRKLRHDLSLVLPIVALWIPPVVGYIPVLLAISAPRQALSRQFHNSFEVVQFANIEYQQRREQFPIVADAFWNLVSTMHNQPPAIGRTQEWDATGPVLDAAQLYHAVFADNNLPQLSAVKRIPRAYLTRFALAIGVYQTLPQPLNGIMAELTPSPWLRARVRQVAQDLCRDDAMLLSEGHHDDKCQRLTDVEVMDACLMRNLPMDCSISEMRKCLTNHLHMIESAKASMQSGDPTEEFGILTLHLSILRDYFKYY